MSGLLGVVRAGVAIANRVTLPLQSTVTVSAWQSRDGFGDTTFAAPVTYRALVTEQQDLVITTSGEQVPVKAKVTFLVPISLDPKDQIVLANGTTGQTVLSGGFVDAGTGKAIVTTAYLGSK